MKKIGIIGAGIMARGMAQNFLKNGYEVHIWNRTKENAGTELSNGAIWEETPKVLTQAADIIIECVSDDDASRSVWLGDEGILAGASSEKVLITSATLTLDWVQELTELCEQKQYKFLDMPLTGSRAGAEGGTLKLLVGGKESVLNSIREELAAIADKIYYFGPNVSGMRFKLVLNSLIAIHANAAAQAIGLAEKAGLDISQVRDVLFDAAMGPASPTTNAVFKLMDQPNQLNWAIKWVEKDLRYARQMAQQYDVDFDLLNDTQADFAKAKAANLGDRDLTQIVNLYRQS